MSCFPDLKWPWCNPDDSDGIFECSKTLDPNVDCCLSEKTPYNLVSNCPDGWVSHAGEWCTGDWNATERNEYRHKCHRIDTLQDSAKMWRSPMTPWPEQCNPQAQAPSLALGGYHKLTSASAFSVFIGITRGLRAQQLLSYIPNVSTAGAGTLFWGTFSFAPQTLNPLGLPIDSHLNINNNNINFLPGAEIGSNFPGCYHSLCTTTPLEYLNELNFDSFFFTNPDEYQNAQFERKEFNNQFIGNGVVESPGGHSYLQYLNEYLSDPTRPPNYAHAYALGRQFLWRYNLDQPHTIMALNYTQASDIMAGNQHSYYAVTPFANSPFWIANSQDAMTGTPFDVTPMYAGNDSLKVTTFALGAPPPLPPLPAAAAACADSSVKFKPGSSSFEPFGPSQALVTALSPPTGFTSSIWDSQGAQVPVRLETPYDTTGITRLVQRGVKSIVCVYACESNNVISPEQTGIWRSVETTISMPGLAQRVLDAMASSSTSSVRVKSDVLDVFIILVKPSTISAEFVSRMPEDVQAYIRASAPTFPCIQETESLMLERPMVNLLAEYGQFLFQHQNIQSDITDMFTPFTSVCAHAPAKGCFPQLSWPHCGPSAPLIPACSEVVPRDMFNNLVSDDLSVSCCLSSPTNQHGAQTCPEGWTADPNTEYCTSKAFDIGHPSQRMLKCHRICP